MFETTALSRQVSATRSWWGARSVLVRDGALAAVLGALAFAPGLINDGVVLGELTARRIDALGVLLALGQCLPLVVRRRSPAICLTFIGLCFCADQVLGYPPNFGSVGLLAALYGAGAHLRRRWPIAAAGTATYLILAVVLYGLHSPERPVDYVTFYLVLAACWNGGSWVRSRQTAEARRRAREVEAAAVEERARIARELHDVVTHHVTAMVVQADATQFLLPGAVDRACEGLEAIGGTGRRALAELRYLLGALNGPGDAEAVAGRAPSPGRIVDLVERVRDAGQPVEFVQEGEPRETTGGPELAVHRIVQEALTNALKHAPGQPTSVRVCHSDADITLEVITAGPPADEGKTLRDAGVSASADARACRATAWDVAEFGGGRGLAGLRQRVDVFGGEFQAGPLPDGEFAVIARLPLKSEAAPEQRSPLKNGA